MAEEFLQGVLDSATGSFNATIDSAKCGWFASNAGVSVYITRKLSPKGVDDPGHLSRACTDIGSWNVQARTM